MDKRLNDKEWRIEHLYFIRDKNRNLIQFKKNKAQRHFNENKWNRNIILKSRQLGFTTFETIDTLDDVFFNRNFDGLLIGQDLETAKDIFSNKVDLAWQNFKLKELYKINAESARQFKFDFGDGSFSSIIVDSSGRSGTFARVHITEFAKVCKNYPDKAKEIIEGTIPAVPLDGRIDIESTADGSEGKFYDIFWNAWEQGQPAIPTQYKAHFYNWQWDKNEINKLTEEQIISFLESKDFEIFEEIKQKHKLTSRELTYYYYKWLSLEKNWNSLKKEYPTTPYDAFASSGNKLFDENYLSRLTIQEPLKKENEWNYYEEPKLGKTYALGVDVGEGIGKDHSAIVIWNFASLKPKVAATYKNNHIAPDLLAYEIKNGAQKYQDAFCAIERNNHGHTTISKLREIYSDRLIYKDDKDKFGWHTNLVSKPKMFFDLNSAINNELIDIPSQGIISEMRRYDKEDLRVKNYSDEETEHYDLLTACCIGFQMKTEQAKRENKVFIHRPIYKSFNKRI